MLNTAVPANTLQEVIALAKAKPGEITYSHPGVGNTGHIAGELLNAVGKVNTTGIPYKGTAPSVIAVLSGEAHLTYSSIPTALPYIRAGRLRALGVGNAKRMPSLPEFPTVSESGLPGYEAYAWGGMLAPAGTPQEIVDRLAAETTTILKRQEVRDLLKTMGFGVIAGGPASLRARIAREVPMWKDVIEKANIKVE